MKLPLLVPLLVPLLFATAFGSSPDAVKDYRPRALNLHANADPRGSVPTHRQGPLGRVQSQERAPTHASDCAYWSERTCREYCGSEGEFARLERCTNARYKYTRCLCSK
jgi:hypothetical protein